MHLINTTKSTVQDNAILMLIDRIELLENELYKTKKENIIRNIASCGSTTSIWADLFMFLLGIDIPSRVRIRRDYKLVKDYIPSVIPKRAIDLHNIQATLCAPFWALDFDKESDFDISYMENACNVYKILQHMSLNELEDYWQYRIQWTKWLMV